MPVARETLFEEIWSEPMTTVAARYGVSSSFLTRVCERLNIPRPDRGHWAKVKVGIGASRPALPLPRPSDELVWIKAGERRPRPSPTTPLAPAEPARSRKPPGVDRTKIHPLLSRIEMLFENTRVSDEGYLHPWKQLMADIFVSKPMQRYAVDVANQLYQLLEEHGHDVCLAARTSGLRTPNVDEREEQKGRREWGSRAWRPGRPTIVSVGTVAIALTVFEASELASVESVQAKNGAKYQRTNKLPRAYGGDPSPWAKRQMPTGRLAVQAASPYVVAEWRLEWRELTPGDLVTRLPSIVCEIAQAASELAAKVADGNKRRDEELRELEAQRRIWAREQREQRATAIRAQSRDELLKTIRQWAHSMSLEDFFRDVETRVASLDAETRALVHRRVASARALLTTTNALDLFIAWQAPPPYESDDSL